MDYQLHYEGDMKYIECLPASSCIDGAQGVLDLLAACYEYDSSLVLLHEANLTPDFFRLKTGVAGEILQKLVNYHIKAALVMDPGRIGEGRFREMVLEANQGPHFRVFDTETGARAWLLG